MAKVIILHWAKGHCRQGSLGRDGGQQGVVSAKLLKDDHAPCRAAMTHRYPSLMTTANCESEDFGYCTAVCATLVIVGD